MMKKMVLKYVFCVAVGALTFACSSNVKVDRTVDELPPIFPDYTDVTIPANVAPLHFMLTDSCDCKQAQAVFLINDKQVTVSSDEKQIKISRSDWKKLMDGAEGKTLEVRVKANIRDEWVEYHSFNIYVANEPMDPYIAYRLIEPGYEIWDEMGIYQRCLEDYDESAIVTNKMTKYNCMNCHSFCMQNPDKMLLHMRATYPCTLIMDSDKIEKLNTKTDQTMSSLVYPSWHPSGRFVAFSVNNTKQSFHTTDPNRVEVFDFASDVVVYDVEKHEIVTSPLLFSKSAFETFPTFSPDGKTLYFCTADSIQMPDEFNKVKYSLCSVSFNPDKRRFGTKVDTLYNTKRVVNSKKIEKWENKSASFPRVSPDGKFLMFTLASYGNFSIWHKDADLYLYDLEKKTYFPLDTINSNDVESYHSWSSNSRWVVFSSRRIDGLYTRPFFAHIDAQGKASKPFLLPQEDVLFYRDFMKSFNIPEFIKGKVDRSAYTISRKAREDDGIDLTFSGMK